ncbi:hypothetical protein BUE60_23415 [Pseudomonas syringae pv. actinidiae]|nr:hypothetical protein BUE60_23415 [Pseudomonas syringae pv. actinidiae]PBK55724.1 hypothetical protein BUE61_06905 [Pseudomonas syringae pv. actinidiae]
MRIIEEQRAGDRRHAAYIVLRTLLGQKPSGDTHFLGMLAHQLNRVGQKIDHIESLPFRTKE